MVGTDVSLKRWVALGRLSHPKPTACHLGADRRPGTLASTLTYGDSSGEDDVSPAEVRVCKAPCVVLGTRRPQAWRIHLRDILNVARHSISIYFSRIHHNIYYEGLYLGVTFCPVLINLHLCAHRLTVGCSAFVVQESCTDDEFAVSSIYR